MAHNYQSQFQQDKLLNEHMFRNKRNGVFVDIGAHDGKTCSNTYFFETELGWTGLCVEPIPSVFEQLRANRKCQLVNGCAWREDTTKTFRLVQGYAEMLSGLVDAYPQQHLTRIAEEVKNHGGNVLDIEVPCFEINGLFKKHGLEHVDLLSIDVEGGELDILEAIDYNNTTINVILVENNYNNPRFKDLLESRGYMWLSRIGVDDVFVQSEWYWRQR